MGNKRYFDFSASLCPFLPTVGVSQKGSGDILFRDISSQDILVCGTSLGLQVLCMTKKWFWVKEKTLNVEPLGNSQLCPARVSGLENPTGWLAAQQKSQHGRILEFALNLFQSCTQLVETSKHFIKDAPKKTDLIWSSENAIYSHQLVNEVLGYLEALPKVHFLCILAPNDRCVCSLKYFTTVMAKSKTSMLPNIEKYSRTTDGVHRVKNIYH